MDVLKDKKIYIISIIIFIYILFLSVGYAFFSESLTINGVASTVEYYEGTKLPTTPILLDTTNNHYTTESVHKNYLDWSSETWQDDTLEVHYQKKFGIVIGSKTVTYTASFTNPTVLDYTDGNISVEITKNDSGGVKEASGSISSSTIKQGEAATIEVTIKHNFLTRYGSDSVTATITYNLQQKQRTFYFIVYFDGV